MIFRDPETLIGYLDAVILHEPYSHVADTIAAMGAITAYMDQAKVLQEGELIRHHGMSNVSTTDIRYYWREGGSLAPRPIIQNRLISTNNCDMKVRSLCDTCNLEYQAFGVLSEANKAMLEDKETVEVLAQEAGVSREAALYALLLGLCLPDLQDEALVSTLKVENKIHRPEFIRQPDKFKIIDETSDVSRMAEDLAGVDKAMGLLKDAVAWELVRVHRVHHGRIPHSEETGVHPEHMPYSKVRRALESFRKGIIMDEREPNIEGILGLLHGASDFNMVG